jgi:hypothetical protein
MQPLMLFNLAAASASSIPVYVDFPDGAESRSKKLHHFRAGVMVGIPSCI